MRFPTRTGELVFSGVIFIVGKKDATLEKEILKRVSFFFFHSDVSEEYKYGGTCNVLSRHNHYKTLILYGNATRYTNGTEKGLIVRCERICSRV